MLDSHKENDQGRVQHIRNLRKTTPARKPCNLCEIMKPSRKPHLLINDQEGRTFLLQQIPQGVESGGRVVVKVAGLEIFLLLLASRQGCHC